MLIIWNGNWWALALRAAAAFLLAVIAFLLPGPTLTAIVLIFGVYAVIDGVLALVAAVRGLRKHERWGAMLLEGIVGVAAGAIALMWPGIGALALVYVMAAWALVTGVLEIAMAVRLRKVITGEWLLILSGVLSILLAGLVAAFPLAGATALAWTLGVYALLYGGVLMGLALRIRQWTRMNLAAASGGPTPTPSPSPT
jgi:uncharacterized membrane protein HdeD (DUF308 family)